MAQVDYKEELESLRSEANRVVKDISTLSSSMAELGKNTSKDLSDKVNRKADAEMKMLRQRLESIEDKIKEYSQTVDGHVRSNPYLYIFGSLGLGALLGKLLTSKSR